MQQSPGSDFNFDQIEETMDNQTETAYIQIRFSSVEKACQVAWAEVTC